MTAKAKLGSPLWAACLLGAAACSAGRGPTQVDQPPEPVTVANAARAAELHAETSLLAAWLPELLRRQDNRPTWTTYELDGRLRFRGPPGLAVQVYDDERELSVTYSNDDFEVEVRLGREASGGLTEADRNTTMGNLPAAIGVVPGYGDLWGHAGTGPGQPYVVVRVVFALKKALRRAVAEEAVDLVRSMQLSVTTTEW